MTFSVSVLCFMTSLDKISSNFLIPFAVINSFSRRTNLGRAVEHNGQSGFELCYCHDQFHGLEAQSSDTDDWTSSP